MSTRTVLVTGAGRGIGRTVCVHLARAGWRVYAGVRTDLAAQQLTAESPLITPVELDVTVPEHLDMLDDLLPEQLDALVNNAGIAVPGPTSGRSTRRTSPASTSSSGRSARTRGRPRWSPSRSSES